MPVKLKRAVYADMFGPTTGDRVRLDVDGFLYFADRDKDMLKVGSTDADTEIVFAAEVKNAPLYVFEPSAVPDMLTIVSPAAGVPKLLT